MDSSVSVTESRSIYFRQCGVHHVTEDCVWLSVRPRMVYREDSKHAEHNLAKYETNGAGSK